MGIFGVDGVPLGLLLDRHRDGSVDGRPIGTTDAPSSWYCPLVPPLVYIAS